MVKVFVHTYGCSLNHSDSEVMRGLLKDAGFELVSSEDEADLLVINSCTVKSNPEQRLFYQIRNRTKPLVVAGCVPQADPDNDHFKEVSVIGTKALSSIVHAVEQTLAGKTVRILDNVDEIDSTDSRLLLPVVRSEPHIAIIPINAGCLSNCSYCKTKQARGNLQSYSPDVIEKVFREAVNKGAKEVWLTSQDTGAYGKDIGTDIVELLRLLLKKPGDYRIRLGMANPQFIIPLLDGFKELMAHKNMFRFLHIPVQAGSDKVLKVMRRGYDVDAFTRCVTEITSAVPDITIATDIIVGFPTESEEDFQKTVDLITDLKIPVVNISKFYPRPGTPAADMKLIPTDIVKMRSTSLKKVCERIAAERNRSFVGKEMSVLIDEPGKKKGSLISRSDNYLQVIIPGGAGEMGERILVTPDNSGVFDLRVGIED